MKHSPKKWTTWLLAPFGVLLLTGANSSCTQDNSGSIRDATASLQLAEQAAVTVGVPAIVNFVEKRTLKRIYELRDQVGLITYTYAPDMNGKLHKVCPGASIGFPIPYAAQYTAPKALRYVKSLYPDGTQSSNTHLFEADQPEPNGLYMPAAADATYVMCVHPQTGEPTPVYAEDRLRTYQFPMPNAVD